MTQSRRELLAKSFAVAAGGMLALAVPGCDEHATPPESGAQDLVETTRNAFRDGNYGVFQDVYISPDEMRLIEEKLARDPGSFPDGEAVLEFLIPTAG